MEKLIIGLNPTMTIEISSDDPKELVQKASFWSCLPALCPICQKDLVFTYRTPQDYKYYGLRCTGNPSHATTFGEYKKGGGLYYKANAQWTVYAPGQAEDEPTGNSSNHQNSSTLSTSSAPALDPVSESYWQERDRALNNPNLSEPKAEIDRLNKLIAQEWHSKPRSKSYDAAIREKFGVSPDKLRINQLRGILEKLQNEHSTSGAK